MESNRYQNGKIYKIVDNGYNTCYIGSTIEGLSTRMAKHRSRYRNYLSGGHADYKVFEIFNEFGIDDCKIELIEEYPCENKIQLQKREGYHIQNTHCVNKRVEGQYLTQQEYREVHKEKIKEQQHEYWVNNKEKLSEHKHQYWVNNKEKLTEWKSEKIVCEICQSCYRRDNRSHHEKSLKHQSALPQD